MNKSILLTIIAGLVIGSLLSLYPKTHLSGHYLANPATIITPSDLVIYNQSAINIEFKMNNSYDLLYVSKKEVGFTSSGTYQVTPNDISLDEDSHQRILPNRELTFYEKVMVSQGAVLSSDSMDYIPLNSNEFILVGQNSMMHFCKEVACGELSNYAQ
ncbi:hypothetical protein L4C33_20005 [Vibrio makurazakiensis]